jgi:hypothetical protein
MGGLFGAVLSTRLALSSCPVKAHFARAEHRLGVVRRLPDAICSFKCTPARTRALDVIFRMSALSIALVADGMRDTR